MLPTNSNKLLGRLICWALLVGSVACRLSLPEDSNEYSFEQEPGPGSASRNPKFFRLFSNLKYGHTGSSPNQCKASGKIGHCVKRSQCTTAAGTVPDRPDIEAGCAFGLTCCLLNAACSPTITERNVKHNLTYIVHGAEDPKCLTLFKFPKQTDVCQLKLEFRKFNISQPDLAGNCVRDSLTIKADNLPGGLRICGSSDAEEEDHLFLHYGDSSLITVNLDILTGSRDTLVDILVKQIKCGDFVNRAPDGCTQYHTGQRGSVRAFNRGKQQLNNQKYSACVKSGEGIERITWHRCNDLQEDFHITGPNHPLPIGGITPTCERDFVTIPGSRFSQYCRDNDFNGGVTTYAKPFVLYVHLNEEELMTDYGPPTAGSSPCPPGFQLVPATGDSPEFCQQIPPIPATSLEDSLNKGFCLRYLRSS